MRSSATVLLFAEDPGAANFIAPLIPALEAAAQPARVIAAGTAHALLVRRSLEVEHADRDATADRILERMRPQLLIVGTASNPDTLALPLIEAARGAAIPSVGVVDAAMNSDRRFRGRTAQALAYAPDWLLVPDEQIGKSYVDLGLPAERVLALGHPHYDYVAGVAKTWTLEDRRQFRSRFFQQAADSRKTVVFASEGSARTLSGGNIQLPSGKPGDRGTSVGRTEDALELMLQALERPPTRPYVVLRAHPKDTREDFARYRDRIDLLSMDEPALELLFASDVVVGMTSMLITEAAILGKPTLVILSSPHEASWLPSVRAQVTQAIYDRRRLAGALGAALDSPDAPTNPSRWLTLGGTGAILQFVTSLLRQDVVALPRT